MRAALDELGRATLPASHALARDFATTLVAFHAAAGDDPPAALRTAKAAVKATWDNFPESRDDPLVRMWRTRVLRHLARVTGSWTTYLQSMVPHLAVSPSRFGASGWVWWIGFFVLLQAARNCSGS